MTEKRWMTIQFNDGSQTERVEVEYPLGHRRRREEARPHLFDKARHNFETQFSPAQVEDMLTLFQDSERLDSLPVKTLIRFLEP